MKIVDCQQGTTAWLMARAGIPTASEFDNLLTPEWKVRTGEMPTTYLYRKVTEHCMGTPLQSGGGSFEMNNGTILESEALPWFMFTQDVEVQRVGFVTTDDGRIGCSPDGLIGEDSGIEVKCASPDVHLKYLIGQTVPKQYLAQVHGSMFVTGRPRWRFMSYSRQFPPLLLTVERDETIMAAIGAALAAFLEKFDATLARVNELKAAQAAQHEVSA